jgi:hypothetical protein
MEIIRFDQVYGVIKLMRLEGFGLVHVQVESKMEGAARTSKKEVKRILFVIVLM